MKPYKECPGGCGTLTRAKYCPKCAARRGADYKPKSSKARGLGGLWRRKRLAKLAARPYCERCARLGITTFGTKERPLEVHHIVPRRMFVNSTDDPDAMDNLASTCVPCHQLLSQLEKHSIRASFLELTKPTPKTQFEAIASQLKAR